MKPSGVRPLSVICDLTTLMGLVLRVGDVMVIGKNYCPRYQKIKENLCWAIHQTPMEHHEGDQPFPSIIL